MERISPVLVCVTIIPDYDGVMSRKFMRCTVSTGTGTLTDDLPKGSRLRASALHNCTPGLYLKEKSYAETVKDQCSTLPEARVGRPQPQPGLLPQARNTAFQLVTVYMKHI